MSAPTTIALSLPQEQLTLLEDVRALVSQQLAHQNRTAWLTEPEAAERLRVSLSTLRKWRTEGWLRYCAIDSTIRYRMDYLDTDFETRCRVPTTRLHLAPRRKLA